MKASNLFCLIISLIIIGCAQHKSSPVEGTWKLVYGKWMERDTLFGEFPGTLTVSQIKMWSKDYVVFVGRFKSGNKFSDNYGGGRYKLQGNRYEENLEFYTDSSSVGGIAKMLLEIKNDTLVQTWPLHDDGQIDKSNFSQEKYIKLD